MTKADLLLISAMLTTVCVATACTEKSSDSGAISVRDVLSDSALFSTGAEVGGAVFERATKIREFHFPQDHGPHFNFRNEWWYVTGNLKDQQGRRFAYQVTFFRVALRPPSSQRAVDSSPRLPRSAWQSDNIWMAHGAVSDIEKQRHFSSERFSRGNPGLAGAHWQPFRVWLDNWKLESQPNNADFPWQIQMVGDEFAVDLSLRPEKGIVLQGDRGLSQKSPTPGNASYYYSLPRLATTGSLTIQGRRYTVEGLSWMDREWSTSALERDQTGWDWFSLQLDTGEELMYYQLLDNNGRAQDASQGTWITESGETVNISAAELALTPMDWWQDKYGRRWPVSWQIDYPGAGQSWRVNALIPNQLMDLSVVYWEGAVEILDNNTARPVGYGFLEMTRSEPQ